MTGAAIGSSAPGSAAQARASADAEAILAPTPGQILRRRIFGHGALMAGAVTLAFILLVALLAPALAPHDPYAQDLAHRTIPPFWQAKSDWAHPLGTDQLGRDYLSRLIYGARISLLIGLSVMLISGLIGTALGVAAGYFGGKVDLLVSYVVTTRLSLPVILVALAVVQLVGGSLPVVIAVLGLLKWDRFAVVMRSAASRASTVWSMLTAASMSAAPSFVLPVRLRTTPRP